MKTFAPDYYRDFRCIAGDCRHTCCAGWTIEIDEASAQRYRSIQGPLGRKLACWTMKTRKGTYFICNEKGACEFITEDNLCQIQLECGEEALCETCRNFPRTRCSFSDRTELGLRLACLEAARIILSRKTVPALEVIEDDGINDICTPEESDMFSQRDALLSDVSGINASCIHASLPAEFMISLSAPSYPPYQEYSDKWIGRLSMLEKYKREISETKLPDELTNAFDQLTAYMIYTFFLRGNEYRNFIAETVGLIKDICRAEVCSKGSCTLQNLIETMEVWDRVMCHPDDKIDRILNEL